mmetsp:Transcript_643/g.2252  ORF Transcript_643/g.2252 Transcript_643/m.2252 type:complete len:250 (+) Transcript_643:168-917(+)
MRRRTTSWTSTAAPRTIRTGPSSTRSTASSITFTRSTSPPRPGTARTTATLSPKTLCRGRQCPSPSGTGSTRLPGLPGLLRTTTRPSTRAPRRWWRAPAREARGRASSKSIQASATRQTGPHARRALCSRRRCRQTTPPTRSSPTGQSRATTRSWRTRSATRRRRGRRRRESGGCARSTRWCTAPRPARTCSRASGTRSESRTTFGSASARACTRSPPPHRAAGLRTRVPSSEQRLFTPPAGSRHRGGV